MKDYKVRRKLYHSQESLELSRAKRKEKIQDILDRVGYKKELLPTEYNSPSDYVSSLGR